MLDLSLVHNDTANQAVLTRNKKKQYHCKVKSLKENKLKLKYAENRFSTFCVNSVSQVQSV